eukprot:8776036-Ditylum_brightwellii.AAC.3
MALHPGKIRTIGRHTEVTASRPGKVVDNRLAGPFDFMAAKQSWDIGSQGNMGAGKGRQIGMGM